MPSAARSRALAGSRTKPASWPAGFSFKRWRSVFLPMSPLAPVTSILLIAFSFSVLCEVSAVPAANPRRPPVVGLHGRQCAPATADEQVVAGDVGGAR